MVSPERQRRLRDLNPGPLVAKPIPVCVYCRVRAPGCTCGQGPLGGYRLPDVKRVPSGEHDPDACEVCGRYDGLHDRDECFK